MKTIDEPIRTDNALLNAITPMGGLEFGRNKIHIGENAAKVYAITKYPQSVEPGWLSKISNIPNTVSCQIFEPCDNGALIEHLSRSVTQYRGVAESSRDALVRQRAEKSADDAEKLMRRIDQNGETVGYMSNLVMPVAKDEAALEKTCRSVESAVASLRCRCRVLANLQKEAFEAMAPCCAMPNVIREITRRNVPLSTFMGGMPFAGSGHSDRDGNYFAKDTRGGLVAIDPWLRAGDRTNTNFVVLGVAGVGKSTAVKHLILSEYMSGTKIICIDPEREMKEMCRNLGGDRINCGGGSGGRINPLEIRPAPTDDEDEQGERLYGDEGAGMGAMALHFKTFEVFIKLYMPDLSEIQKAVLKQTLERLYADFGITWDTDVSALKPKDFPTFGDLYALLRRRFENPDAEEDSAQPKTGRDGNKDIEYLTVMVRELAEGSDSFLWNGHTSLNPKSRFVCLDTFDLQNTSDAIKKTQYYNILTWAWDRMSRDRSEKVLLVCDEAYLLVDPNVPQSLIFLRNVAKRARKYEAGIVIVSHSVVDFLDPAVKLYGQALMDIPAYKILMGCDGKNLAETAELYGLTEVEREQLLNKKRGHALFFAGAKRLLVRFDVPDYKLKYMGRGGGR
ncbi:MAG: DUF87 domain-containing protein [Clostridiales Family XIII bacterium]|jgi:hypothetical protein|nr:DUF87 domain-containing protein [Clostridiales Family XIII bacterium]